MSVSPNNPKPLTAADEIMMDFQDAIDRIIEGPVPELDTIHRQITEQIEIRDAQLSDAELEVERLREFLNDIGYPDTAINVMLDATEVVDALEEQEKQHSPDCNVHLSAYEIQESGSYPGCTCGLYAALEEQDPR